MFQTTWGDIATARFENPTAPKSVKSLVANTDFGTSADAIEYLMPELWGRTPIGGVEIPDVASIRSVIIDRLAIAERTVKVIEELFGYHVASKFMAYGPPRVR